MTELERFIFDLLDEHEETIEFPDTGDIWQYIADLKDYPLPCMDICGDIVSDINYYGCDFSQEKQVIKIFFTGTSNYFPGIWIKENQRIDECPIYIFDLASSEDSFEPVGNLKTYLTTLLNFLLEQENVHPYYIAVAKKLMNKINTRLSDNLISNEIYKLKING